MKISKFCLFLLLCIFLINCNDENTEESKNINQIPTYYIYQHIDQVIIDSTVEKIGYKISKKNTTKQELIEVGNILKKRGWSFYYNSDSSKIFIANYTKKNEDILTQLYLIGTELQ